MKIIRTSEELKSINIEDYKGYVTRTIRQFPEMGETVYKFLANEHQTEIFINGENEIINDDSIPQEVIDASTPIKKDTYQNLMWKLEQRERKVQKNGFEIILL